MPKLSSRVIEEKKAHIEKAARELFIRRGFHATPMRQIAAHAGVSLGNLYKKRPPGHVLGPAAAGRREGSPSEQEIQSTDSQINSDRVDVRALAPGEIFARQLAGPCDECAERAPYLVRIEMRDLM